MQSGLIMGLNGEHQKEVQARLESLKPSSGKRLIDLFGYLIKGVGFLSRGFLRALVLLVQTPVYLVSFVFNYIRSAIAVMIMFFVTKVAMFFGS